MARQRWDALRLPILMVTAKTDPESVYAAFDAGASDYVGKPFRGAELRARIAAHLRTRRLVEERARMEEHLRERDKLFTLGLLAGGVAHDLNNPLAVICAHAQLLLRQAPDDRRRPSSCARSWRRWTAASRIVGDLLNFARRHPAERGAGGRGRRAARHAGDARAPAGDLGRGRAGGDGPDDLPLVTGDCAPAAAGVPQRAGERGARAAASAAAPCASPRPPQTRGASEQSVAVEFWNDGPPIPPDVLPHIFDPLFTTKAGDEGTGLGLSICRRIVREHGGGWTCAAADGTAFAIRLPVYPE